METTYWVLPSFFIPFSSVAPKKTTTTKRNECPLERNSIQFLSSTSKKLTGFYRVFHFECTTKTKKKDRYGSNSYHNPFPINSNILLQNLEQNKKRTSFELVGLDPDWLALSAIAANKERRERKTEGKKERRERERNEFSASHHWRQPSLHTWIYAGVCVCVCVCECVSV